MTEGFSMPLNQARPPLCVLPRACRITAGLLIALLLAACGTVESNRRAERPADPVSGQSHAQPARSPTQQQLANEAEAMAPLAKSDLAKQFLRATDGLPTIATRVAYRDDNSRDFFSPQEAALLPADRRKMLTTIEFDEYRYYYTKYGSPLAYMRLLDLAYAHGLADVGRSNILDVGYGSIGHLRLLASLGANVTGVDPDRYLNALYREASDQGSVAPAKRVPRGRGGSLSLAHGRWPGTTEIAHAVSTRGPYQLIISKNTLKRGYLKPERRAPKSQLIELGVSDDVFLKSVHAALAPGGLLVIYNLAPKQAAADKPYLPHADARSPFSAEQFARAGLEVLAIDTEDHAFARQMGAALGWDKNDKGETVNDLDANLFALYTLVRRAA